MDADAGHLQKFTDVPYVIEASASRSKAATAAARALSGIRVDFDDRRPLPKGRYGAIVESVRAQINEDLRPPANWRIDIFDRTAPDLTKEGRRIDRTLSGFKREVAKDKEGAFATPFPVTAGPGQVKGCVIVGFPEGVTPAEMLSGAVGGAPVPAQGMTAERFHRNSLWHELGHCLLGGSEAKADTFAVLMSLRHGNLDKAAIATLASWRELNEWTTPRADDDHFIAASLWEVVARADALVADKRFMAMGIEGIAGLAKSMTERFGLDADGIREAMAMREAFQAAARQRDHVVPGPGGKPRKGDLQAWGAAHVDIPEIARMDAVALNLMNGAKPLKRFDYDFKAFRARLDGLARGGDPTAKAMVASLERSAHRKAQDARPDFVSEIPYRFDADAYARGVLALAPGASLAIEGRKRDEGADAVVETAAAPGPR